MIGSQNPEASGSPSEDYGDAVPTFGAERRERRRRRILGGGLLAVWAVISLAWAASVGANLYYRASDQADMSAEIDHDLDAAACTGPQCAGPAAHAPQEDWTKVASTYLKFGYWPIIEWAMLPPVGLLLLCMGSCAVHRRWTASTEEEG